MACGCIGRDIKHASEDENNIRTLAKKLAKKENVWCVVIRCSNGNLDFVREKDFEDNGNLTIVEYISPM